VENSESARVRPAGERKRFPKARTAIMMWFSAGGLDSRTAALRMLMMLP
jgi:hypothetical protein